MNASSDLREIKNLISAHINAFAEHDRLYHLSDWGLCDDRLASDAICKADEVLVQLCKARPVSPEAVTLRRQYLSAKVPPTIEGIRGGIKQDIVDALIGGGSCNG